MPTSLACPLLVFARSVASVGAMGRASHLELLSDPAIAAPQLGRDLYPTGCSVIAVRIVVRRFCTSYCQELLTDPNGIKLRGKLD
jgi:hypothetical protein